MKGVLLLRNTMKLHNKDKSNKAWQVVVVIILKANKIALNKYSKQTNTMKIDQGGNRSNRIALNKYGINKQKVPLMLFGMKHAKPDPPPPGARFAFGE
jgi:hypothetical protein